MQISILLLSFLFWGSSIVWWYLVVRLLRKQPLLEQTESPRPRWRSFPEFMVLFFVMALFLLSLKAVVDADHRLEITPLMLVLQIAIPLGMAMLLIALMSFSGAKMSDYGIRFSDAASQLRTGFEGFLAVILPTTLSLLATFYLRPRDSEHALLKLLDDSPNQLTIGAVIVAAAIAAPLWEELQFRVILQGWLSTLIRPSIAIGIVAVAFSMVHGWRDGIALLPLALILGYVYERKRSYLSVVVIHALFNATMLTLQLLNPNQAS